MAGNVIMVLATISSRRLRSICNMLICLTCLLDILLFTGIVPFLLSVITPITQEACYYINIPADFGACASNALLLSIGVDRLIAVSYPTRYKILPKPKYLLLIILPPIIYSTTFLIIGFLAKDPTTVVACLIPSSLGIAFVPFAISSVLIISVVPIVYGYVYIRIKKVQMSTSAKSVFRSLLITVILVICGWMTTDLLGFLTVVLPIDPILAHYIQLYCGIFTLSASAMNVFVYYSISKDYRIAIRSLLGYAKRRMKEPQKANIPKMDTALIILVIIYSIIITIGISGNLIMVLATIYSRNLRSSCNILISACCIFDLMLYTSPIAFMYSMYIPISQELCYYISIPCDFGAFASNAGILAVGIDRLLAVRNPALYKLYELDKPRYIARILFLPIIYSIILLYIGYTERDATRYVACLVPESLGVAYKIFALTSFIMILFVPPVYGYVFWKIRQIQMSSSSKSVFKSLSITVILVLCGWMTTDLIGTMTVVLPMDHDLAVYLSLYCGIFALSSSMFNVFVYYTISKECRRAIKSLFGLAKGKHKVSSVLTNSMSRRASVTHSGFY